MELANLYRQSSQSYPEEMQQRQETDTQRGKDASSSDRQLAEVESGSDYDIEVDSDSGRPECREPSISKTTQNKPHLEPHTNSLL